MTDIKIAPPGPLRAGDFAIVAGQGFLSDGVSLAEDGSRWTHVLSVLDGDHYIDPVWPTIVERSGIIVKDSTHFTVRVDALTALERTQITKYLRATVGQHYGLTALAWAGLTILCPPLRKVHDPVKTAGRVCSTTLAWAYWLAGRDTYAKLRVDCDPEAVTPAMLARVWGAK